MQALRRLLQLAFLFVSFSVAQAKGGIAALGGPSRPGFGEMTPVVNRFLDYHGLSLNLTENMDILSPVAIALDALPGRDRSFLLTQADQPGALFDEKEGRMWKTVADQATGIVDQSYAQYLRSFSETTDVDTLRASVEALDAHQKLLRRMRESGFFGTRTIDAIQDKISEQKGTARNAWVMQRARADAADFKSFIDGYHGELFARRPDLFYFKMRKAAASDLAFARAFPAIHYQMLRKSPYAQRLAQTIRIWLHGDLRPDNVEVLKIGKRKVPEVKDVEDSGWGPAALEIARMMVGSMLVGDLSEMRRIMRSARKAYRKSLGMSDDEWIEAAQKQKPVSKAKFRDRNWRRNVDNRIQDTDRVVALNRFVGFDPPLEDVHEREGAGLSSIGLRRFMFFNGDELPQELRELRDPAIDAFGGEPQDMSNGERVLHSYRILRAVGEPVKIFVDDQGVHWFMRQRREIEAELHTADAESVAKVMGMLAGRLHRGQALIEELYKAEAAVTNEVIEDSVNYLRLMRQELNKLLRDNVWGAGAAVQTDQRPVN